MSDLPPDHATFVSGEIVAATSSPLSRTQPTAAGQAALAAAQALGRKAAAPATLRAYKADWMHYAAWCAAAGLTPVPAEPATVGATLASLKDSHAPHHGPPQAVGTLRRNLPRDGVAGLACGGLDRNRPAVPQGEPGRQGRAGPLEFGCSASDLAETSRTGRPEGHAVRADQPARHARRLYHDGVPQRRAG